MGIRYMGCRLVDTMLDHVGMALVRIARPYVSSNGDMSAQSCLDDTLPVVWESVKQDTDNRTRVDDVTV